MTYREDRSDPEIFSLRRRLAVQTAVTHVLAETTSFAEAIPVLLAEIGGGLDWDVGAYWQPTESGDRLERAAQWYAASARTFVEGDPHRSFAKGEGLPGRVWLSERPEIIEDISTATNFQRKDSAIAAGLRSALAFPVHLGGELFGVLEFFAAEFERADVELLDVMRAVGIQLGQFVQRQHNHAAILESEAKFRIFAESASDATFTIDAESKVLYANPAVERIFGYRPEELVGRSLALIIPERLRAAHFAGIHRYQTTGKRNIPWAAVEIPGLHKDGHEVDLEISFGEYDREGLRFYTGIARDVTERKRQQQQISDYADKLSGLVEELEARTDEAEAASRAKSLFLANMSHEIRTPINAILGYGELLQMGIAGALNQDQAHHLERIRASAKHLLSLITDVLDLSKIESGQFSIASQSSRIFPDVEAAVSLVRPQAVARHIQLAVHCADDAVAYVGDAGRVRQILVNLLSNAVKFTEDGGAVTVTCGVENDEAIVRVEDTGIGISPDDLLKIFDPFVQASSGKTKTHGGTGLGLSISRQLADLMNGSLSAESHLGEGSAFTLRLPVSSGQRVATDGSAARKPVGVARDVGIALIRDTHRIVSTFVRRLQSDTRIGETAGMSPLEIADHASSLIVGVGQALTIVGEAGTDVDLLRDSSDILRLVSERHGEQRAHHNWSFDALEREFVVLRSVIEEYLAGSVLPSRERESVLTMIGGFLENAGNISLKTHANAVAAGVARS